MLWHCTGCTTAYAAGLPACPHCGATGYRTDHEEDTVPKVSKDVDADDQDAAPRATYDGHVDLSGAHVDTPEWVDAGQALDEGVVEGDRAAAAERAAARPEPAVAEPEPVEPTVPVKDTVRLDEARDEKPGERRGKSA